VGYVQFGAEDKPILFERPKSYETLIEIQRVFRKIKPAGRLSIIVESGEDPDGKENPVHFFDSQWFDKAFFDL
jgi:hypothetical protein